MPRTDFRIDEKSLEALEYYQVIDLLQKYTSSPTGREFCRRLRPQADVEAIKRSLSRIDELKRIEDEGESLPPVELREVRSVLGEARVAGAVLEPQALLDIAANIETCQKIKKFFTGIHVPFPCLKALIDGLTVCKEIGTEIRRCLDPDGTVRDEASPRLRQIRASLREVRTRIQKEMERILNQEDLQPVLRDRIVTQRNGRAVLLVKPEFRGRIKAVVHDYSHSRMSLFVEPISVVEMNNDLNLLLDKEREEEFRILEGLTGRVRERTEDLQRDLELLGELDLIVAKMRLGRTLQAIQPEIGEIGGTCLLQARHPLLFLRKRDETVPIDILLPRESSVLIISGANAGGKTVALKTLGLLVLMFQSGMEIPVAEGSRVSVYQKVFAEVGDEQSIGDDLSTFSAHLAHLDEIVREADSRSLVLVDEIGAGTNVTEGAALAMGALDCLKEKGAAVVVTTHLEPLKAYGYVAPGVTNVGVEFDPDTLEPRYRLSYGTSAPSRAFLVAEKMGVSREVLDRARSHQRKGEGPRAALMQKLEHLYLEAVREREQLQRLQRDTAERRDRLDGLIRRIRQRRDRILLRIEQRGMAMLKKTERELQELSRRGAPVEPGKRKPQTELREIENRLRLRFQVKPAKRRRSKPEDLRPGESVRILDLNKEGTVSRVHEGVDIAEVMVGQFKIKTSLYNLERVPDRGKSPEVPSPPVSMVSTSDEVRTEINVIGLRVDEALPVVDRFIDRALLQDLGSVTIVHGSGSGRLREAIRQYLRQHKAVRGFADGDPSRGGSGITVVQLGWESTAAGEEEIEDPPPYV
ncbi:MAG: endonuclease MutS2 [Deltaproteobacteria bacterium]|nr:endonuclease MutS2 [Deltaproteobacteria bacterium]